VSTTTDQLAALLPRRAELREQYENGVVMFGTGPDLDAARRADLVLAWVVALGHWTDELSVLADATRYDQAHPDEPSLRDELCAATAGDPAGVA
jgi:hypothetical protein